MKREQQIKKSRPEPWEPGGRILYCFHRGNLNVGAICGLSAILFVTIILIFLHSKSGSPALGIPVPIELAKLEAQLRAYLEKEIQWARAAPRDANRQATMGIVYSANGLWEEARIAFENAAKLNPNEPLAQLYVGIAKQGIGDLEGAVKTFTQVTTRFPDFPQGYYRLGDALLRMGVIDQAEPAFRRLIDLAPRQWHGYVGMGDVYLRQGRHAEAAKLLEKALEIDPDAKVGHYLLGLAYRGLGRLEDAKLELAIGVSQGSYPMEDAWSRTLPQHMKLLQDQMDIANEYSQSGQPGKAVEILSEPLAYQPRNLTLANALAIACNRSGQPDKGRQLLLKVLEKNDRYLPAYITISYSCADLGLNDESLSYAERAIQLAPNLAQSYLAKANALLAAQHDIEALSALESAFRCDPRNAEIQIEMGDVCLSNLKRSEEALEHYRRAAELNPALGPAHARLASLCIQLGHPEGAAAAIATLRKISPKMPELAELEVHLREATHSGVSK